MKFDLFTAKAPPLFGLDISSSSVKMLELVDGGKSGYRVERYAIEPLARTCDTHPQRSPELMMPRLSVTSPVVNIPATLWT